MVKETKILAIESSCDETAAAVVANGRNTAAWYRRLLPAGTAKISAGLWTPQ